MFDLLRILSPVLHPVGFVWTVTVVLAVIAWRRGHSRIAQLAALAITITWVLAQPFTVHLLFAPLERPWVHHTVDQVPTVDAIVVLGGGWRPSASDFVGLDLTPAGDRWITGLELVRRGVARHLVVGGDDSPRDPAQPSTPDSDRLRTWLELWNPGRATLHTLGPVPNTRAEAVRTRELAQRMGWKHLALVTSALHLSRAVDAFEAQGLTVHPVACDFQILTSPTPTRSFRVLPDEESLALFTLGWHEWLGHTAYRAFGFLRSPPVPPTPATPVSAGLPAPQPPQRTSEK
ncbi:MAG: YdcF family protein [Verrucomicrobiales bacterium]|nr:YdcF family protein [Verrucomicrobiales bacterium]